MAPVYEQCFDERISQMILVRMLIIFNGSSRCLTVNAARHVLLVNGRRQASYYFASLFSIRQFLICLYRLYASCSIQLLCTFRCFSKRHIFKYFLTRNTRARRSFILLIIRYLLDEVFQITIAPQVTAMHNKKRTKTPTPQGLRLATAFL